MTEDAQRRRRRRNRLWLAAAVLAAILAGLLVPPFVSISRYKKQITELVSTSLGRPVRLSSVELRLLPWPGFVLTNLTVEDDPAYGAEPILHANTVTASIRLLSLWRGKLELGTISVDEASLNLVRAASGSWNLDPIFRTAAAKAEPEAGNSTERRPVRLPYLEATNSRINIKNGLEKLPFSLVDADLSFWEDSPGNWRVRLRGQPARTDVNLDLADTGIVQIEASLHRAAELRQMPVVLDMEWKEAQLGQLSRLIVGSDPGWRGDLRGEMHVEGTAQSAKVRARLRATGVHRAEFAPAEPLDFDANCSLVYHYSGRSIDNLACDSPLGDGHIRVVGDVPGNNQPKLAVELQQIPVQAGLDLLRTLRSGLGPDLEASGTVSGKLTYESETPPAGQVALPHPKGSSRKQVVSARKPEGAQLAGSVTVDGFKLSGDSLGQPIQIQKITLAPAPASQDGHSALNTSVAIPAGGSAPLEVGVRLARSGYQLAVHGPASLSRIRQLAKVSGLGDSTALSALSGSPAMLDLNAEGPWLSTPAEPLSVNTEEDGGRAVFAPAMHEGSSDQVTGTLMLHDASWTSDVLANKVEIAAATLHLDGNEQRWDPVDFSYGPLKGTASLDLPTVCGSGEECLPKVTVQFQELNAEALQAALLGAHQKGTLLASLLARLRPSSAPIWPRLDGRVKAAALVLGPVTLHNADVALRIAPAKAEITALDAALLGGRIHATGEVANGDKPDYTLNANFEQIKGDAVCQLLGLRCVGGVFEGSSKVELSGFTSKDLTASAKGTGQFEWRHGALRGHNPLPPALVRFDEWSGEVKIADGVVKLGQNEVRMGERKSPIKGEIKLVNPPRMTFAMPTETAAAKR